MSDSPWTKSSAHLQLLGKFLRPRTAGEFAAEDRWQTALGESQTAAIKRFLDEGVLARANLSAQLDYRFKASELKDMLKTHGLPVSGRKAELIQRLVEAHPEDTQRAVEGLTILLCSDRGRKIAEQYVGEIKERVMGYLRERRFNDASMTVASYEAEQVFQRGIGIDWRHYDPTRDITMLNAMFSGKPKILSRLDDAQSDALRLAAGMMYLWGTNRALEWRPADVEMGLGMDNDAAARMFLFYGSHLADLAEYKRSGVVNAVEILAMQDSCDACQGISGKRFKLNEALELPYEHCTQEGGCRCTTLAVTT